MKLFNHCTDDEEYSNNERQCLIKMFAVSFTRMNFLTGELFCF